MKSTRILLALLLLLVCLPSINAQDTQGEASGKKAAAETAPPEIPLKVQVVLTEFDGSQKISSLPYMLNMLGTGPRNPHRAFLRYGVRVPIVTGSGNQVTYQDVGTNIDCSATQREEGDYRLDIGVERSSVSMPGSNGKETDWKPGDNSPGPQPLIRSFRDDFTVVVKNGQTAEGTSAVDPVTGHVLKIEVTLTVLK